MYEYFFRSKLFLSIYQFCTLVTYGCNTWNLTIRAQERLLVFESIALCRILGPRRDPITARVRMPSNGEIHRVTGQTLITSVIKFLRLKRAGGTCRSPATVKIYPEGPGGQIDESQTLGKTSDQMGR